MSEGMQTVDKVIKEEPVDDSHDSSSLDMKIAVKIEPVDFGEDADSLHPANTGGSEQEAATDVKQEIDIGPIVLQPPDVHYTWRPCKPEPVEYIPSHSLDMKIDVKIEPADFGEDTSSLHPANTGGSENEAATDVKQKIDIGPIVLQPPDVHFTPQPWKPEPVMCTPSQNTVDTNPEDYCPTEESASTSTAPNVGTLSEDQDDGFRNQLNKHVLTEKWLHRCNTCFKYFTKERRLNEHMMIHKVGRPHCCDICKKNFRSKSLLKNHKLIHSAHRPYCCVICKKDFKWVSTLNKHMSVHTADRPHKCDFCQKQFYRKSHLNDHMFLIHTEEIPHCCNICEELFHQKTHLERHMSTHK